MEVKIGVQHAPRELVVETDDTAENIEKMFSEAVAAGGVLTLTDSRGRKILVPADRVSYVEIGGGVSGKVGFRLPDPRAPSATLDTWTSATSWWHSSGARSSACSPSGWRRAGRDNIPLWLTIICGIGGVVLGTFLYSQFWDPSTAGIDWWRHFWQIAVAAVLVMIAAALTGRSSKTHA